MDAILRDLTDAQRAAVTHVYGPQLILAGPGSGKTRVVTHRIAYMLTQGIAPWNIVALTFTNKAADEMRKRIDQLAPGQPVWMGTFHRFCARLLRQHASQVGLKENYSILDTGDSKQILKRAIEFSKVSTSHISPEKIASIISRFKNRLVLPQMLEGQSLGANEHLAARVYGAYQLHLLMANAVDFDDLLLHAACLLRDNPELRADLDLKHRFIMVDEYQDTNLAQYAIVRALSIDNPNLSVTGDPDQSIYGWRGADISNILGFEKDYQDVHTVRLEENYRSTPEILHVADTLICHNAKRKAKDLFTNNPSGPPVVLRMYQDSYQEADDIAEQVARNVQRGEARPGDVAIFCRMNSLTRAFEHAFNARGIPYQIVNGTEFYQRKEIKDLLAYLHLINNPGNDVAFMRVINVPARGIGAKTLKDLTAYADQYRIPLLEAAREAHSLKSLSARYQKKIMEFVELYDDLAMSATLPVPQLLELILERTGYQEYLETLNDDEADNDRLANVDELITAAAQYDDRQQDEASLEGFLEQVALVSDSDAWDDAGDRVSIMTMHAAKGLEFPHVYVIAVENELLPHKRSMENESQIEEERRLLFVGITRAERFLQLSYAKMRTFRGSFSPMAPSFFLVELPRDAMNIVGAAKDLAFARGDYDDDYNQDPGYPDSWDVEADESDSFEPDSFEADDDICQLPDDQRGKNARGDGSGFVRERPKAGVLGMQTAAEMLQRYEPEAASNDIFRVGMRVSHPKYGEGEILTISGRNDKRTAKIRFDIGHVQSFILKFAQLERASD